MSGVPLGLSVSTSPVACLPRRWCRGHSSDMLRRHPRHLSSAFRARPPVPSGLCSCILGPPAALEPPARSWSGIATSRRPLPPAATPSARPIASSSHAPSPATASAPTDVGSTQAMGGFKDEHDFHLVADEMLEHVMDMVEGLEERVDDFESNLSQGVLNIQMGHHGVWVLNKQTPNRQIWWSSPISGPLRFEYEPDKKLWVGTRDGKELLELLRLEVEQLTGAELKRAGPG